MYPIIGGILLGAIVPLLFLLWRKKKSKLIPAIDERNLLLFKRYLLGAFYVVMIGSSALLITLYGIGIETIETGMIIVYMAILYILIIIGAMVTKRL
jgi:hypothetical protein